MPTIGDLIDALHDVTSICAVRVALFDSHADATSALSERVGNLAAMMRLAVDERDEAIAERDATIAVLELAVGDRDSEVARLESILANDHTKSDPSN